jgi:signal transduction histidine kinase
MNAEQPTDAAAEGTATGWRRPLPHALDDFSLRGARWGAPAFAAVCAAAYSLAGWSDWLQVFVQLALAWACAFAVLAVWRRRGAALTLAGVLPASALASAAAAAGAWLIGRWAPGGGLDDGARLVLHALAAGLISAMLLGVQLQAELRLARQRARSAERERAVARDRELLGAQLAVLQAQIEPHFLYNSLATVQVLTRSDAPAADAMLGDLIDYLRSAMPAMRGRSATLGSELELARAYLSVMRYRMGERLQFTVDAPRELLAVPLPPTLIGTLIENAIKHGLEPSASGGRLDLSARSEGDMLVVEVADTGLGVGQGSGGSGVGLANARERLVRMHGARAELDLLPNTPRGVVAQFRIPLPAPADATESL